MKLAGALDYWKIKVMDRACLDVGASTGGFTDCLLQRGATHVTAVDTGFGQIAMKLRNDSRVRLMERTNARLLSAGALAGSGPELTLLVMDVSFISATLILRPVLEAAPTLREAVVLVRDPAAHQLAIDRVAERFRSVGWEVIGTIPSPITGAEGNREFLLYARN
jgi:23S rRNA (cytidine1920-2'-O)/16S rRNA (cytidine1409-2'-O)-methyltransferase